MHSQTLKSLSLIAILCFAAACGDDDDSQAANNATNNGETNNASTNNATNSGTNNATNNATNNTTNNATGAGGLPSIVAVGSFIASDFSTSGYGAVTPGFEEITTENFGTGDVVVAAGEDRVYAIDRGAGLVQVLDPTSALASIATIELQAESDPAYTTNPQGVIEAGGAIWMTLSGTGEVVRYVETEGTFVADQRLDLGASFEEADGNLDPAPLIASGDTVMVGVQYLGETFAPSQAGALILIDAATGDYVDADAATPAVDPLVLPLLNPTQMQASPSGAIGVGLVGVFGEADGGIVLVEPTAAGGWVVGDTLVTEADLGGNLNGFVLLDDASGFAIVSAFDFSGSSLVLFEADGDDVTVTPIDAVTDPAGLAITGDREHLLVGDRGEAGGVVLLDAATRAVLWGPISADLPPSSLAIVE